VEVARGLTIERTVHQQLSGIYNAVIALPEALLPVVIAVTSYRLPVTGLLARKTKYKKQKRTKVISKTKHQEIKVLTGNR
jgi:hypothetical protein